MEERTQHNLVALSDEGYVMVKLVGKQDYMTMDSVAQQCRRLADQLRSENKPVLGLVDFSDDENFDTGTNRATLHGLESIDYDKAALFGANKVLTEVTRAVVAALGKGESTKVFDSREEALAWLAIRDPLKG